MSVNNKESISQEVSSISDLRKEINFMKYIELLIPISKQFAVFIASSDTPCGSWFSARHSKQLMKLGLKVDLFRKHRFSYATAIYAGEVLFESISPTTFEFVEHSFVLGNLNCKLKSVGFDAQNFNTSKNGSTADIVINGVDYVTGGRGLNFLVFDPLTEVIFDSVTFDTFEPAIPCLRHPNILAYINNRNNFIFYKNEFLKYQNEHPEISVVCFNLPVFPKDNLSGNEKYIVEKNIYGSEVLHNFVDSDKFILKSSLSRDEIIEVITAPIAYHDIYGIRRFEDKIGRCINISDGHRVTTGQPKEYKRTVFLVGNCKVFGIGVRDSGTMASVLQELLNNYVPEQKIIVQNYGHNVRGMEAPELLSILNSLPVKPNDIIFFWAFNELSVFSPSFDFSKAARRPHNYGEIFFDKSHFTENGHRFIAGKLFEALKEYNFFEKPAYNNASDLPAASTAAPKRTPKYKGISEDELAHLEEYKRSLKELAVSQNAAGMKCAAAVMNCNPFTLGHQYLIEQAAEKSEHLYIFVVQEDKSDFPFADRLKLVKDGTAHLKNVTVMPSGRFIISSLTFQDYFNKSEIQSREIDTTMDITLFAKEIAPCLNIRTRFAGEEPFDNITRQYNETMRRILPQYGMEFIEIPRKTAFSNTPISASYVRKLLKERKFDEIALIVPKVTLKYLKRGAFN